MPAWSQVGAHDAKICISILIMVTVHFNNHDIAGLETVGGEIKNRLVKCFLMLISWDNNGDTGNDVCFSIILARLLAEVN
jgi:high-affinity nickel permease